MKINDIQRAGRIQSYSNQNHVSPSNESKKQKKDEISISPQAKEMLQASAGSEVHSAKLDELKNAVATGTYHVDADQIVEKLLPYFKRK